MIFRYSTSQESTYSGGKKLEKSDLFIKSDVDSKNRIISIESPILFDIEFGFTENA